MNVVAVSSLAPNMPWLIAITLPPLLPPPPQEEPQQYSSLLIVIVCEHGGSQQHCTEHALHLFSCTAEPPSHSKMVPAAALVLVAGGGWQVAAVQL